MALYDFSGERKSQISFRREDLFLVEPRSGKWLHAEKGEESGWVPQNYILVFDKVLSEKPKRIITLKTTIRCLFQKAILSRYTKKVWDGVLVEQGTELDTSH